MTDKLLEVAAHGYAPYGETVLRPDGRTILPLRGIECGLMIFQEIGTPHKTYGDFSGKSKLRLRPISCLTKPITAPNYNQGKEFVPLVELAKAMGIKFVSHTVNTHSVDFVLSKDYMRENTKTKQLRKARFWFDNFSDYGFCISVEGCRSPFLKQLVGIELLNSWLIDWRDLIGKGLAVEITEL